MKLCADNSTLLGPHLLAITSEIDHLGDLPDVGALLERSGILDTAADGGTPSSLRSFDMPDFTVEDNSDDLPFEGILDLSDRTSSVIQQNLIPCDGMFSSMPQSVPFLTPFPLESAVQQQDLVMLGEPSAFSNNFLAAPHLADNWGIVSTVCGQQMVVKQDGSPKFVSLILSGTDDNQKQPVSRSSYEKNKSGDSSASQFLNNKEAPEYQRVMDILTEYRVQVAEKSAEALMPCKRRKSRPLVDVVDVARSVISTSENQTGAVASMCSNPAASQMVEQPGDLSSLDSVASSSSELQNTAGVILTDYILSQQLVNGCALDAQTTLSQGLSCDKAEFRHNKTALTASSNMSSGADSEADTLCVRFVKRCEKRLEMVPECQCHDAGEFMSCSGNNCHHSIQETT